MTESLSATVAFCDIVSFSTLPSMQQLSVVGSLTDQVRRVTCFDCVAHHSESGKIMLPTGDGLGIAFVGASQGARYEEALDLATRLHLWAKEYSETVEPVSLRIGINVGTIHVIKDINGRTNVCGSTINRTQRIMDAANARQTLISEETFSEIFGNEKVVYNQTIDGNDFVVTAGQAVTTYAKHNLRLVVRSLNLNSTGDWYDNSQPLSKNLFTLALSGKSADLDTPFLARVEESSEMAFIQLSGDRLRTAVDEGLLPGNGNLARMIVLIPSGAVLRYYRRVTSTPLENFATAVRLWRATLARLQRRCPQANLRLVTYESFPFFGASFFDWTSPGGTIHVSPYVWDLPARDCPGFDLHWVEGSQPSAYSAYIKGLENLLVVGTDKLNRRRLR